MLRTTTFTWLFRCCVFYTPTYLCMEHSTYTTRAPQFATLAVPTDRSTRSAFCGLLDIVWRASNLSVELSCLMFANSQGNNLGEKGHSAPMKPTMSMNTASKTLNLQSSLKAADLSSILHSEYVNQKKLVRTANAPPLPVLWRRSVCSTVHQSQIQGCPSDWRSKI